MSAHPLRLLIAGYGLAAASAGLLSRLGASFFAAFFVFWFGGAILTVALALLPGVSRLFTSSDDSDDPDLEAELRRWEEDRRAGDAPAAEAARTAGDALSA